MSTRQDIERLRKEVEDLTSALKESRADAAAHLRNIERLSPKATRTVEAEAALARTHRDRDDAFRQITILERQVANRDAENAKLAGELAAALAVIESAQAAAAWKPTVVR